MREADGPDQAGAREPAKPPAPEPRRPGARTGRVPGVTLPLGAGGG